MKKYLCTLIILLVSTAMGSAIFPELVPKGQGKTNAKNITCVLREKNSRVVCIVRILNYNTKNVYGLALQINSLDGTYVGAGLQGAVIEEDVFEFEFELSPKVIKDTKLSIVCEGEVYDAYLKKFKVEKEVKIKEERPK